MSDSQPECSICGEYLFEREEIKANVHMKCDFDKNQTELEEFVEMLGSFDRSQEPRKQ